MRVADVKIYAMGGAGTADGKRRPTSFQPYCTIEDYPEIGPMIPYKTSKIKGKTLYYREANDRADFFLHDPRNERGYGGAVFSGVLEDGTEFKVRGPWSSSDSFVNSLGLLSTPVANLAVGAGHSWRSVHASQRVWELVAAYLSPDWVLEIDTAATPCCIDLADDQASVVQGTRTRTGLRLVPTREFDDCVRCSGVGSLVGPKCSTCSGSGQHVKDPHMPCWNCGGKGHKVKGCDLCGWGCTAGIGPYPHLVAKGSL